MLSLFKKKTQQSGEDIVSSSDLIEHIEKQSEKEEIQNEEIYTELSIHPKWRLSPEDRYVYQFMNMECSPLKPNQVSLSGIELEEQRKFIRVTAFIRNSLDQSIELKETTLLLLNGDGKVVARKTFNLSLVGQVPAKSSRPWHFDFPLKMVDLSNVSYQDWKLAFELKSDKEHQLDLDESWEKSLAQEDKDKLIQLTKSLSLPKSGEVNFMGIQAGFHTEGNIYATILIRNGSEKNITIQHLPLEIYDHSGNVIVKGSFNLENFEVKSHTTKPWTFIFPRELLLVSSESVDLTTWKVSPVSST